MNIYKRFFIQGIGNSYVEEDFKLYKCSNEMYWGITDRQEEFLEWALRNYYPSTDTLKSLRKSFGPCQIIKGRMIKPLPGTLCIFGFLVKDKDFEDIIG